MEWCVTEDRVLSCWQPVRMQTGATDHQRCRIRCGICLHMWCWFCPRNTNHFLIEMYFDAQSIELVFHFFRNSRVINDARLRNEQTFNPGNMRFDLPHFAFGQNSQPSNPFDLPRSCKNVLLCSFVLVVATTILPQIHASPHVPGKISPSCISLHTIFCFQASRFIIESECITPLCVLLVNSNCTFFFQDEKFYFGLRCWPSVLKRDDNPGTNQYDIIMYIHCLLCFMMIMFLR